MGSQQPIGGGRTTPACLGVALATPDQLVWGWSSHPHWPTIVFLGGGGSLGVVWPPPNGHGVAKATPMPTVVADHSLVF
jgi:hypothetical protein